MGVGSTRTYSNISPALFAAVKQLSAKEHGTVYDPPDGNQGTATTQTAVGEVQLTFDYDPSASTLTYTITEEPFLVTDNEIWGGICATIKEGGGTC